MIDVFAESVGIPMNRVHCKAVFGEGMFTFYIINIRFICTAFSTATVV